MINHLMLPFLEFSYANIIANYGLGIIFLTIIIKLILYPLTKKQFLSMKAMQTLQPEFKKLREKYKNDPQKMQMELMSLYKEKNVSPFSGCLPMLVQLPILFALYFAVTGETFSSMVLAEHTNPGLTGFWLPDLTKPDSWYILPVIIGLSTYYTQKMMPTSTDPAQQKVLMFMPVLMVVICWKMPAGVLLYWASSQLISAFQQYLILHRGPEPS